jgi:hypothetical protein
MPNYGTAGHLGVSAQQSFGTATTSYEWIPFVSEGLATNIDIISEETIRARFDEPPIRQGVETSDGDIVFEVHPTIIGHFLRGAFASSVTTVNPVTGPLSGVAYHHWFVPPVSTDFDETFSALPPYSIEIFRGVGSAFIITDTVFNSLSIDISAGQLAQVTASVLGRTQTFAAKNTPSFDNLAPLGWNVASISLAGTGNVNFETLNITLDNAVEGRVLLDSTVGVAKFKRSGGFRNVRVTGTLDFESAAEFENFKNFTEQVLVVRLQDSSVTSLNTLELSIPSLVYEAHPVNIGGPGLITADITARGIYNTGSAHSIRAILVNSRSHGY